MTMIAMRTIQESKAHSRCPEEVPPLTPRSRSRTAPASDRNRAAPHGPWVRRDHAETLVWQLSGLADRALLRGTFEGRVGPAPPLARYVGGAHITPGGQCEAVSTSAKVSYHHSNLRIALLSTAMGMLERGESFSLRALARATGVSPTAPYRHFADRDALESALAAEGLRDLKADLVRGRNMPRTVDELAEFGVIYVDFALRRPALFRLMFDNPCDEDDQDRVRAAEDIHELLASAVVGVFPDRDPAAIAIAGWGLVHGLACLHLAGKLPSSSDAVIADQVRSSFVAAFAPHLVPGRPGSRKAHARRA